MVQVEVLLILVLIASAMTVPVTVDEAAFVLDTNGDAAKDVEIPPLPWEYSTNETCLPFLESIKQAVVKSGRILFKILRLLFTTVQQSTTATRWYDSPWKKSLLGQNNRNETSHTTCTIWVQMVFVMVFCVYVL